MHEIPGRPCASLRRPCAWGSTTVGAGLAPPAATVAVSRAGQDARPYGDRACGGSPRWGGACPARSYGRRYPGRGKPRPYGHQCAVPSYLTFNFPFSIFRFAISPPGRRGRRPLQTPMHWPAVLHFPFSISQYPRAGQAPPLRTQKVTSGPPS